ncbi:hypothetical protein E2P81_ATG10499, partial [Venturia nashicola]
MSNQNSSMLDDEKTRHIRQTIQSLFNGCLTAEAVAAELAVITVPNPNINPRKCEGDLRLLWCLVLASLIAQPDRVDTIGNLIICISKLPPPITKSGKQLAVNQGILRVWDDTPGLAWALRDEWD